MSKSKKLATTTGVAAAVLVLAAAGCAAQSSAPASDAPSSTPEPSAEASPAGPDWETIAAFNKTSKPEEMAGMVSPGSPAARWLEFHASQLAAEKAAGVPAGTDGSAVTDEAAGTVTHSYSDGSKIVLKDWVTDAEGRIVSWSDAAGTPLASRLWTQPASGSGAGQTVTLVSAYATSNGEMIVVVDVAADGSGLIDYAPTYVGPDGVAREPSSWVGTDLTPGAVTKAYYVYDGASFGGKFVYAPDWDITIELPIA